MIKYAEDIIKEIKDNDNNISLENCVTGEEFEEWLRKENKEEQPMILLEGGKWLYRLEAISPEKGLWYNSNNDLVFNIGELEDCETKNLPMDYDWRYHKDNKCWFSSCSNKEDLSHWYSLKNAQDLIANGFQFTRYYAIDYVEYENETTFLKETALAKEIIPIEDIMGGE